MGALQRVKRRDELLGMFRRVAGSIEASEGVRPKVTALEEGNRK
jgi:hypothetical protein